MRRPSRQVLSVQHDPPDHGRQKARDRPEEGRLPRAVRSDDRHGLSGPDLDVDVVDDPFAEVPGG